MSVKRADITYSRWKKSDQDSSGNDQITKTYSRMGNDLTLISRGQKNVEEFLFEIEKMVTKLVSDNGQPVEEYQKLFSDGRKEIGKCPRCGNKVMWEREIIIVQEVIAVLLYGKITDF